MPENERIKYEQRIKWTDLWKKAEIAVCSRIRAGDSYVYSGRAGSERGKGDVACDRKRAGACTQQDIVLGQEGAPDRNDIVVLEKTAAPDVYDDNIIARVAGLPGETVEIKDGKVYIDGDEYVAPGGIKGADGEMKVKLKKNEVFLLCDNRDEDIDSRNEKLGPVDMKAIKGRVLFSVWPLSRFGGID